MNKPALRVLVALLPFLLLPVLASSQSLKEVVGTWEGESKCTVIPSPCHDEHVIYEITQEGHSNKLSISADKVVEGERINMGTLPCSYHSPKLECTYRDSLWTFVIKDKEMAGKLTRADGTVYRKITAHKK